MFEYSYSKYGSLTKTKHFINETNSTTKQSRRTGSDLLASLIKKKIYDKEIQQPQNKTQTIHYSSNSPDKQYEKKNITSRGESHFRNCSSNIKNDLTMQSFLFKTKNKNITNISQNKSIINSKQNFEHIKEFEKTIIHKQLMKKILKAKVMKCKKNSIILDHDHFELMVNIYIKKKINDISERNYAKRPSNINKEKLSFNISKSPQLLSKDKMITKIYEDYYVTPKEFLSRNFNNNEIELLKSDPEYYGINEEDFKETELFQNKTLLNILNAEEGKKLRKKSSYAPSSIRK